MTFRMLTEEDFAGQLNSICSGHKQLFERDRSLSHDAFVLISNDGRFGHQRVSILYSEIDSLIERLNRIKHEHQVDQIMNSFDVKECV